MAAAEAIQPPFNACFADLNKQPMQPSAVSHTIDSFNKWAVAVVFANLKLLEKNKCTDDGKGKRADPPGEGCENDGDYYSSKPGVNNDDGDDDREFSLRTMVKSKRAVDPEGDNDTFDSPRSTSSPSKVKASPFNSRRMSENKPKLDDSKDNVDGLVLRIESMTKKADAAFDRRHVEVGEKSNNVDVVMSPITSPNDTDVTEEMASKSLIVTPLVMADAFKKSVKKVDDDPSDIKGVLLGGEDRGSRAELPDDNKDRSSVELNDGSLDEDMGDMDVHDDGFDIATKTHETLSLFEDWANGVVFSGLIEQEQQDKTKEMFSPFEEWAGGVVFGCLLLDEREGDGEGKRKPTQQDDEWIDDTEFDGYDEGELEIFTPKQHYSGKQLSTESPLNNVEEGRQSEASMADERCEGSTFGIDLPEDIEKPSQHEVDQWEMSAGLDFDDMSINEGSGGLQQSFSTRSPSASVEGIARESERRKDAGFCEEDKLIAPFVVEEDTQHLHRPLISPPAEDTQSYDWAEGFDFDADNNHRSTTTPSPAGGGTEQLPPSVPFEEWSARVVFSGLIKEQKSKHQRKSLLNDFNHWAEGVVFNGLPEKRKPAPEADDAFQISLLALPAPPVADVSEKSEPSMRFSDVILPSNKKKSVLIREDIDLPKKSFHSETSMEFTTLIGTNEVHPESLTPPLSQGGVEKVSLEHAVGDLDFHLSQESCFAKETCIDLIMGKHKPGKYKHSEDSISSIGATLTPQILSERGHSTDEEVKTQSKTRRPSVVPEEDHKHESHERYLLAENKSIKRLKYYKLPQLLIASGRKESQEQKVGIAFKQKRRRVILARIAGESPFANSQLSRDSEILVINGHRVKNAQKAAEFITKSQGIISIIALKPRRLKESEVLMMRVSKPTDDVRFSRINGLVHCFGFHGRIKDNDVLLSINGVKITDALIAKKIFSDSCPGLAIIVVFSLAKLRRNILEKLLMGNESSAVWNDDFTEATISSEGCSEKDIKLRFHIDGNCELSESTGDEFKSLAEAFYTEFQLAMTALRRTMNR